MKAAQAPLAAARANHEGDVKLILLLGGGGGRREPWVGVKGGRRGSAAASIEDIFRGGGGRHDLAAGGSRGVGRKGMIRQLEMGNYNFYLSLNSMVS